MVNVTVGRIDNCKAIEVQEGTSISSAIEIGGFDRKNNEKINDLDGQEYSGDETVENGGCYLLTIKGKDGY